MLYQIEPMNNILPRNTYEGGLFLGNYMAANEGKIIISYKIEAVLTVILLF